MRNKKITIWVEQRCSDPSPTNKRYEYIVKKAQNTTEVKVGEFLSATQINSFCAAGWTVNIS